MRPSKFNLARIPYCYRYSSRAARAVGSCFAEKHEPDVRRVATHLVKKGFDIAAALRMACSSTYEKSVRTKIRPQEECSRRLHKTHAEFKAASEEDVRNGGRGLML